MRPALVALCVVALALTVPAPALAAPSAKVERALQNAARVHHASYHELRSVSWCESRWNPRAVGNGSHGLFQFLRGTWARTPYRAKYIYSAWWNALAAAWLWRHDGRSWHEWTCKP